MDYTTSAIIEGIKGKINVPTSQGLYPDDASFLQLVDRELRSRVVAFVLSLRQDFLLVREEIELVNGQTAYDLPDRMFSPSEVMYKQNNDEFELAPIQPGVINNGGYYFLNEKIVIGANLRADALVIYYYRRPGFLVPTTSAAQITNISGVTLTTIGTLTSSFINGVTVDLIEGTPPFRPVSDSVIATTISSNTVGTVTTNTFTMASTPPSNLVIGDWIAIENESPIPQIPYEAFHYLELCSSLRILMAGGYMQQYGMAMKDLNQLEADLKRILVPRADRQSKRITTRPFGVSQINNRRWFGYQ